MKVLMLNGSAHPHGCTATAFDEMARVFAQEGVETEILQVGNRDIRGCIGCGSCAKTGRCVFRDDVNEIAPKFEEADALVVGGASVVSCRRGGNTASFDVLNKYFLISGMPLAPSTYWNMIHGFTAEDALKDLEGLQTMRNLARNMVFLMKAIRDGKEAYGLPEAEHSNWTSFPDGK